jgi:predicted helicase
MKNKNKNKLAKVYHYDLYGKRDDKYKFLDDNSVNTIEWNELEYKEPYYFFVPKDFDAEESYNKGFKLSLLSKQYGSGIVTDRDSLFFSDDINSLSERIEKLLSEDFDANFIKEFRVIDSSSYNLTQKIKVESFDFKNIIKANYRPFDTKYLYYKVGLTSRPGYENFKHILGKKNIGLVAKRGLSEENSMPVFITNTISDRRFWSRPGMQGAESIFPLYLYPEANEQATLDQSGGRGGEPQGRTPNLDMKLVGEIAKGLGLEFRDVAPWDEGSATGNGDSSVATLSQSDGSIFTPIDLLDYIYAVLHSPTYREKYKEFLKIDFPRVPYPKDKKKFWQLVDLGSQIRQLHLLETADKYITSYPNDGTNIVERKMTKNSIGYEQTGDGVGRVWINDEQYFDGVPEIAWNFYIGGYQPAQKWLKDRVSTPLNNPRPLTYEDINHYQKIIVALTETDRLMKEIDKVGVE